MEEDKAPQRFPSACSEQLCQPVPLGSFGFFKHPRGMAKTTCTATGEGLMPAVAPVSISPCVEGEEAVVAHRSTGSAVQSSVQRQC